MIGQIKIGSGLLKGMTLKTPAHIATHPMGAREKNALFNMLRPKLAGAKVADLFAGTGALGIEALSNGAKSVIFVENFAPSQRILAQNLAQTRERLMLQAGVRSYPDANLYHNSAELELYRGTVQQFLPQHQGEFDLVLADPPYQDFQLSVVEQIGSLLRVGGTLALSFPGNAPILPGLALVSERHYAAAGIAIYEL